MSTKINIGWLKDKNGDKFAPKTLTSQIQTSDGILLEDKIGTDLSALKEEVKTYANILNNNKADVNHNHDDRYYTETEVDELIANLDTQISGAQEIVPITELTNCEGVTISGDNDGDWHHINLTRDFTPTNKIYKLSRDTMFFYTSTTTNKKVLVFNLQPSLGETEYVKFQNLYLADFGNTIMVTLVVESCVLNINFDDNGDYVDYKFNMPVNTSSVIEDANALSKSSSYTPSADTDLSTKKYVDNSISALSNTYYTETEIDTKLSAIDDSIANITSGTVVVKEAEHADSADEATHATTAETATKATQDGNGNVITETYQTIIDEALETTNKTIVGAINELNSVSYVIPPYELVTDEWSSFTNIDIMQLEEGVFYYVPNGILDETKTLRGLRLNYIADDGTVKTIYQGKPSIRSFYLSGKSNTGVTIKICNSNVSYYVNFKNHDTAENIIITKNSEYLPILTNNDYLSDGGIYVPTQNNDPANKKYVDDKVANIDLSTYETTENASLKLDEAKAYADTEVAKVQGEVDALEVKVGEVAEGTTIVEMIGAVEDIADDNATAIGVLEDAIKLKADKTALDEEIERAKAAEKANADEIARVNGVLVSALENDGEGLDSIKELATWVNEHGQEAAEMTQAINGNTENIYALGNSLGGALNSLGNELSSEISITQGRMDVVEDEIDALQADTHTHANKDVLDGITAEQVAAWNLAEANVQADWNENNPESDAFIKNRPFYETIGDELITFTLDRQSTFVYDTYDMTVYGEMVDIFDNYPEIVLSINGKDYNIKTDNIDYNGIKYYYYNGGKVLYGNFSQDVIELYPEFLGLNDDGAESCEITLRKPNVIKTLDTKYLPSHLQFGETLGDKLITITVENWGNGEYVCSDSEIMQQAYNIRYDNPQAVLSINGKNYNIEPGEYNENYNYNGVYVLQCHDEYGVRLQAKALGLDDTVASYEITLYKPNVIKKIDEKYLPDNSDFIVTLDKYDDGRPARINSTFEKMQEAHLAGRKIVLKDAYDAEYNMTAFRQDQVFAFTYIDIAYGTIERIRVYAGTFINSGYVDVDYTQDTLYGNISTASDYNKYARAKDVAVAIQGVLDVASANTTAINGHNDRIVALESKVGDGFVEITSAEIQALFA